MLCNIGLCLSSRFFCLCVLLLTTCAIGMCRHCTCIKLLLAATEPPVTSACVPLLLSCSVELGDSVKNCDFICQLLRFNAIRPVEKHGTKVVVKHQMKQQMQLKLLKEGRADFISARLATKLLSEYETRTICKPSRRVPIFIQFGLANQFADQIESHTSTVPWFCMVEDSYWASICWITLFDVHCPVLHFAAVSSDFNETMMSRMLTWCSCVVLVSSCGRLTTVCRRCYGCTTVDGAADFRHSYLLSTTWVNK